MNSYGGRKQTILMFPWLGHGHISPFLELAKKLITTNLFNICLCSTPANLDSIKKTLKNHGGSSSIRLIELHLWTLPGLPPNLHTTNGLPLHLMSTLKQAFDMASPRFSEILKTLKPDLLIYDMIQPWAPVAAAALGIPSVVFITTSVAATMFHFHMNTSTGIDFPFSSVYYRSYEYKRVLESLANNKDEDRLMKCVGSSLNIVLVKSFKEIEGKYVDYLSFQTGKKIVPVGLLVADPFDVTDVNQNSVIQWLNKKAVGSTVFVSFGSEYFLSSIDLEEIAYGLELSDVNFIWVLRFPKGVNKSVSEALPFGFLETVKDRGLVVEGWAPQTKILGHKNIGGFVSHCGWSSVMEAMKFGVPIIAMPMHLDQPINARLVEEVGVGVEVVRDEDGRLRREKVAAGVKHVVVDKLGEAVREKAKKLSVELRLKGEEEIDAVAKELLQLCQSSTGGGGSVDSGGGGRKLRKTKSETLAIGTCCVVNGEV